MGVTHSNKKTYPRLGDVLGFVEAKDGCLAAEKIMLTQRDNGNRADRKNARLKYTVDRMGVEGFKAEVERRMGKKFGPARPYHFDNNLDTYGWVQGHDGNWHFTCSSRTAVSRTTRDTSSSRVFARLPRCTRASSGSPPTSTASSPTSSPRTCPR